MLQKTLSCKKKKMREWENVYTYMNATQYSPLTSSNLTLHPDKCHLLNSLAMWLTGPLMVLVIDQWVRRIVVYSVSWVQISEKIMKDLLVRKIILNSKRSQTSMQSLNNIQLSARISTRYWKISTKAPLHTSLMMMSTTKRLWETCDIIYIDNLTLYLHQM